MNEKKMRQKVHNILRRLVGKEVPVYKVYGLNIKDEFGRTAILCMPLIEEGPITIVKVFDGFKTKAVEKSEPIVRYVSMRYDYDAIESLSDKAIHVLYIKLKSFKRYMYVPEGLLTFWHAVAE